VADAGWRASPAALTLLSEEETMFRDAVAAFAEEEVRARVMEMEKAGRIDPALFPKYFELGLMGIEVPEQYGGAGGSLFMVTLAVEEISKIDAAAAIVSRRAEHAGELPDPSLRQRCAEGEVPAAADVGDSRRLRAL
jgi:alkylation response protein AidB-like acyl-CoA dehydrogenase